MELKEIASFMKDAKKEVLDSENFWKLSYQFYKENSFREIAMLIS